MSDLSKGQQIRISSTAAEIIDDFLPKMVTQALIKSGTMDTLRVAIELKLFRLYEDLTFLHKEPK